MIKKTKFICILIYFIFLKSLCSYEIIRDPIFENYFSEISKELKLNHISVYLINNKTANAFVISNNVYFTTGLLDIINNEDTIKAIFLHEYGHIINNHLQSKKIQSQLASNKTAFYNLFSIGLAALTNNSNIAIGTSITLNTSLIKEISKYSVNHEIEADNFMIQQIKINEINTLELIDFLNITTNQSNNYFKTHPNSQDRINNLKELNYKKKNNSKKFEWIKSKYSKNSDDQSFNIFFENLEKGIFNQDEKLNNISKELIKYEGFKKGIFINNWDNEFKNLMTINNSPYLKIEYINYILDNNLNNNYSIVEDLKFDKSIMSEYYYYFVYGKYYDKMKMFDLSNFYFCQFYKTINSKNKSDFFCEKYDTKNIPTLDKAYALFK